MIYPSGTTGRPKGVRHPLSHAEYGAGTAADHIVGERYPFGPDTVYLSPAPLYHAAPIMWTMVAQRRGGTTVIMESFDAELALSSAIGSRWRSSFPRCSSACCASIRRSGRVTIWPACG